MKKNVIVLGTGFGAYSFLKNLDVDNYKVIIVSPRNHFLFTPLLPSTTVGTIEFRSIIEPIRNLSITKYYQSYCIEVIPEENSIICSDNDTDKIFRLEYDFLVIGVGEITKTYNIPGVKEYAYFLKEVTDARKIRVKVIDCFENAEIPGLSEDERKRYCTFIVCGGGPTGIEFAAELNDFLEEDVSKKYPEISELSQLILIESQGKILNTFDAKLIDYTQKLFRRENIKLMTNTLIEKVEKDKVKLKDGTFLPYGLLIWATGNDTSTLVKECNFEKSFSGKLLVDEYFRINGQDNIYAIGDCSQIDNNMYPVTAQTAQQEGKHLAKNFNRLVKTKNLKPFKLKNFGMLTYIGQHKALIDTNAFKGSGFFAFIFWRSVYITKLVSIKNKILVMFDWFKTFIFGRDVSNF